MSGTYSDVDASADPSAAVSWQDRVDRWPHVRAYKRRILELLADADRVVDVGCGSGGDVVAIGTDRCVGVDKSRAMCAVAAERGATICRGDAQQLPLADQSFKGAVADRVLQHVDDPMGALAELVRVVRPGGRLVIADPDQETLSIVVPGVRQDLVERVKALRRDIGYRNGRFISTVPATLIALGLGDVSVDPYALALTDPDEAFGIPTWTRLWQAEGEFSQEDVRAWEAGVDDAREAGFLYSLIYFVVSGVRR